MLTPTISDLGRVASPSYVKFLWVDYSTVCTIGSARPGPRAALPAHVL